MGQLFSKPVARGHPGKHLRLSMSLLGKAVLAMWWDVSAESRPELEHWHAHEHFAERLAIPGFQRASRWTAIDDGEGFFVMYELEDHSVLASAPYVARLNAPSPWSTRMMPLHRSMVLANARWCKAMAQSRPGTP